MNKAYKDAGVDITAGYKAVELIKRFAPDIGGFGGMFSLSEIKGMDDPVMVAGTDGVGTKIALAKAMNRHDTVGIDLVAMCVNDIVTSGAKPLFFLDYIACGKVIPERIAEIVKGIAEGCAQAGAALIGGETAEHPGLMPDDDYDLAGFACGVVDRKNIIDGGEIAAGDALVGLASGGVHSNGFSLIRKVFGLERAAAAFGDELLVPTKIYVKRILSLAAKIKIKGMAHITGGGLYENIPRMLPSGLAARVSTGDIPKPKIFDIIAGEGGVSKEDMYNTFNMGVGMVLCCSASDAAAVCKILDEMGERAFVMGEIVKGDGLWLE